MTETPKQRKIRTNKQNAYLWGVVYPTIAKALADRGVRTARGRRITEEDIHLWCKNFFIREEDVIPPLVGTVGFFSRRPSTATMTTQDFQEYIMAMQAHFAEFGVYISDPNEEQMMGVYGKKVPLQDYSEETA